MSSKKIKPILQIIGSSALTSLFCTALFLFAYLHIAQNNIFSLSSSKSSKTISKDTKFATYEAVINNFFNTLRKGNIENAYKSTSPVFQEKTSLDDFQKLVTAYQSTQAIPASSCSLTQYSDPFSSSINGLSNTYMIVQTKCEAEEKGEIKGFDVEFIEDAGIPKISYINAYTSQVVHTK